MKDMQALCSNRISFRNEHDAGQMHLRPSWITQILDEKTRAELKSTADRGSPRWGTAKD